MNKLSKILITFICLFTLIFTNTALANIKDPTNLDKSEVRILIEKAKNKSADITEINALLEKVKQGDTEAVKWFKSLAINNPEKIKKAFKGGIVGLLW